MITRLTIAGLLLTAPAGAVAEGAGEVLHLDPAKAVDLALENHPTLLGEKERLREVKYQTQEARAEAYPQVSGHLFRMRSRDPGALNDPDFERFIEELAASGSDQDFSFFLPKPLTVHDYRISVEQALYQFGRIPKAIRVSRVYMDQVANELLDRELLIARDAVQACYNLARAEERMEVLAAERISRERQVKQAADFLEIGTGTRLQLLQARAALAALRPRELEAEGELKVARVRMNEAIGRDPLEAVDVVTGLLQNARLPLLPSTEELVDTSTRRPDLQALAREREVLELRKAIQNTNLLPELKLTGSYGIRSREVDNLTDTDYASWDIGLYVDWTIFDGKATMARMRRLESQKRQNRLAARARQAAIARDLVSAIEAYNQSREAAEVALVAINEAEEAHRVANESRKWGASTLLEVLEAERTLTEARFQRLDAVHKALTALAEIDYQTGRHPQEVNMQEIWQ